MRIELNQVGQTMFNGTPPSYKRPVYREARGESDMRLPVLDWPENLFSTVAAMADETATYQ